MRADHLRAALRLLLLHPLLRALQPVRQRRPLGRELLPDRLDLGIALLPRVVLETDPEILLRLARLRRQLERRAPIERDHLVRLEPLRVRLGPRRVALLLERRRGHRRKAPLLRRTLPDRRQVRLQHIRRAPVHRHRPVAEPDGVQHTVRAVDPVLGTRDGDVRHAEQPRLVRRVTLSRKVELRNTGRHRWRTRCATIRHRRCRTRLARRRRAAHPRSRRRPASAS